MNGARSSSRRATKKKCDYREDSSDSGETSGRDEYNMLDELEAPRDDHDEDDQDQDQEDDEARDDSDFYNENSRSSRAAAAKSSRSKKMRIK